jgi:hypothetical protein
VIEGRAKDPDAVRSMGRELEANLKERRPDVLGMVVAWHGDGGFTQAVYFRSEQEARQREQETEQDAARQRVFDAMEGAPTFLDIRQPDLD